MATKKKAAKAAKPKGHPVIVCANNAVIFGWTEDYSGESIRLTGARHAYYWRNLGGHAGLAATGPQQGSRVGAACTMVVRGPIVAVLDASAGAEAWAAWPVTTE